MKKQKRTSIGLPLLLTNTEELLKRESLKTSPLFSEAETRKLSEELQLRMAEPEFQNIKLKLTSNPALDLTENYHALNEFKQSGLFTLSLKGEIIEINISGSQMLGKKSARLINKRFSNFISDDTLSVYNIFLEKVFNSKSNVSCEVTLSTKGNFPMHVLLTGIVPENGAHCIMSAVDITFCKLGKTYREMGWEILQLLDGQGDLLDSVKNVISALKVCTGLDAVGFRLQNGDDFPYFAQKGFSGDFIMTENSLVEQEENGKVCVNKDGHINLECTCGLVISGKTDPADPFSTQGGSIWSNDSFPFLGLPAGEDPRLHPRNKCISNGYASVALIPVKNKDRIVGMLQFCDRRKGCFTPDTIETLEGISSHIGIALFRKLVDDKLSLQSEILENMPEGVFLYSADDGLIVYTNPKLEHMFGYDPKELIGKHVSVVNAPNERSPEETSAEILQSLLINGIWCGEVENIRKDGTIFWSQVNVSAFEHPHYGKVWISIQQDISKRKQLEKALRESETILNNAQQIAHVGSWELDDATHELRWSEETFRIFGFEPHSVSPTMELFLQCIHPEDLPDLTESIIVAWDLRNPFSKDHRIILPDGQVRIVHEQAEIKYTDTGKPEKWMGIVQDITYSRGVENELRDAVEQMRHLTQYIEKVRENERVAISRELHDDLGQALTAIKIDMATIRRNVYNVEVVAKINRVSALLNETIKTVQNITSQLRPQIIDDLGIQTAIEWYTDEYTERTGLEVFLNLDPVITISPTASLNIFRIMQESLTNIARHSMATRVDIELNKSGDSIKLRITDNGIGIVESEINSKMSYGILSMKERATATGGTFTINSRDSNGTLIELNLPFE